MNTDKIKNYVENNMNRNIKFRVNGNRNQVEEFNGKIVDAYKAIFLVKPINESVIKSYTYTDVLIGNLEINI